jgi:hypothetical protein
MAKQESSFTVEQQAFIREVVFEAVPVILERHIQSCPWGRRMTRFIFTGIGIGVGLTIAGFTAIANILGLVKL